jgi:putative transposase
VTVCTHNRVILFGENENGKMVLPVHFVRACAERKNEAGRIVEKHWKEISIHFPHAELDHFVVMPNHIHGLLLIVRDEGAKDFSPLRKQQPSGTSKTIGSIIRGFKIGTTKWMREQTMIHNVWQRNYYDRVIRNEADLNRIREYIAANPMRWAEDSENPRNTARKDH